jgi:hypothetical protein
MSHLPTVRITELSDFLAGAILQQKQICDPSYSAMMLYLSDDGAIQCSPFRPRLPYEYASTPDEVFEGRSPRHFDWPDGWPAMRCYVPEFTDAYRPLYEGPDDTFEAGFAAYQRFRRDALVAASSGLPPDLTLVSHGETEVVYEISCEHVAGPRLPSSFPPRTGIQAFARFYAFVRSGIGRNGPMTFSDGHFVAARFFGRDVTDDAIALLTSIPDVASLCSHLHRLDAEATAISDAGFQMLQAAFPTTEIRRT